MELYERPTLQVMSIMVRNEEKDKINSFPYTSKTHSMLKEKKFVPLYADDLHFLITRAGWLVTHIYEHCTFEQSKFNKDFMIMNQKLRQKATSPVKRDFFKLLNNSNFGIDCRITLATLFWNLLRTTLQKYFTLKNSTIFSIDTFRNIFSPAL